MKGITLIGMPGSGKSTTGKALATLLSWEFVDTDDLITPSRAEAKALLDTEGPAGFAAAEERLVTSLPSYERTVIAPGGSVVYSNAAMRHLRSFSTVVFLNAPLAVVRSRAANPFIVGLEEKGWDALYAERLPLYRKYADIELAVGIDSPDSIAQRIQASLSQQ